jgi:hypothetical protein
MPGGQARGCNLLMRRPFRWVLRLVPVLLIPAVVGLVTVILMRDTIARDMLVRRLRSNTGMEVSIRAVHVGLRSPTLTIEGLKLYNPPEFGGSLGLDLAELRLQYDWPALRAQRLHLTSLRLDLRELSILKDQKGRNNFGPPRRKPQGSAARKNATGRLEFTGIDVLDVSLGKFRLSDAASGRGEEIDFAITNQVLRDVKSEKDLSPLGLGALSHGNASSPGNPDFDLSQFLDNLLGRP